MIDRIPEQMAGIAVFARVVEMKSFTGAAASLGLTKSAVSKQIARLEDLMGVQLLRRTTRSVGLTDAGQLLYERAVAAIAVCRDATGVVSELVAKPHGLLRVSAPVTYGRLRIAPLLPALLRQYPDLKVKLALLDRPVDLAEEGFDLAIRLAGTLPQEAVARALPPIEFILCAARGYFDASTMPRDPDDLARINCLRYGEGEHNRLWHFDGPGGTRGVHVDGNFAVNNSEALRDAVLQGLGVALLPDYVIATDIQEGRAVPILGAWAPRPPFGSAPHLLWLPDRHMPPKTRAFVDYLCARIGVRAPNLPAWTG